MPSYRSLSLAICLTLAAPAMAQAQAFDGCDIDPSDYDQLVAPLLAGNWTAINGTGLTWMFENGVQLMSMPMPPEESAAVEITYRDGTLSMSGGDFTGLPVEITQLDGVGAAIPVPDGISGDFVQRFIDFDTVGRAPNCSEEVLPVLHVDGSVPMPGVGSAMSFEGYYFVVDDSTLSGVALFDGGMDEMTMHARRFVTLRRN